MSRLQQQMEKEKRLDRLKTTIEHMPKERHLEVLRKLMNYSNTITISSNRYGVYVNLSFLPDAIIDELHSYVDYITDQEKELLDRSHLTNNLVSEPVTI